MDKQNKFQNNITNKQQRTCRNAYREQERWIGVTEGLEKAQEVYKAGVFFEDLKGMDKSLGTQRKKHDIEV